jgi:hypothetical protein
MPGVEPAIKGGSHATEMKDTRRAGGKARSDIHRQSREIDLGKSLLELSRNPLLQAVNGVSDQPPSKIRGIGGYFVVMTVTFASNWRSKDV